MSEDRTKEFANTQKLYLAEITLPRARGSEIVYVRWLDDAARRTPEDPDPVTSGMDATQVNTYGREDVVLATLPIKASRTILSPAATKPKATDQHWSSGVGWRRMKAWYGERDTKKRWEHEVKNNLLGESVVDVPTTIVSEIHGYVRMAHCNTKIMSHIGPKVFGGEMIEGHHAHRRRRRRGPRKSEWESNSKHANDMTELSRRKLDSKRTSTPFAKATGKGRRDTDD